MPYFLLRTAGLVLALDRLMLPDLVCEMDRGDDGEDGSTGPSGMRAAAEAPARSRRHLSFVGWPVPRVGRPSDGRRAAPAASPCNGHDDSRTVRLDALAFEPGITVSCLRCRLSTVPSASDPSRPGLSVGRNSMAPSDTARRGSGVGSSCAAAGAPSAAPEDAGPKFSDCRCFGLRGLCDAAEATGLTPPRWAA